MADNAVVLWPIQAACRGSRKVDSPSNQKVSCRRVTAPLCTSMRAWWELLSNHRKSWKWREPGIIINVIKERNYSTRSYWWDSGEVQSEHLLSLRLVTPSHFEMIKVMQLGHESDSFSLKQNCYRFKDTMRIWNILEWSWMWYGSNKCF